MLAVGAAGDRVQQHPLDLVREGRLVEATPGSSMPSDGVTVLWCAPPSGLSETPAGVPAKIIFAPT